MQGDEQGEDREVKEGLVVSGRELENRGKEECRGCTGEMIGRHLRGEKF